MKTLALLSGVRFLDSLFPSGGFAFSSGLESAVHGGAVCNVDDYSAYVVDQLHHGIGSREAVAVGLAHEAAANGDITRVIALDHELDSMKLGLEGRRASRQMGRQVARVAADDSGERGLRQDYAAAIEREQSPGHLPIALGVTLEAFGWEKEASIAGFLYQTIAGYNAAALKLLPIGQGESQRLLRKWTPVMDAVSRRAAVTSTLSSWTPIQDVYAMRHSRLESRLFRS